jgi:hypothetical protein
MVCYQFQVFSSWQLLPLLPSTLGKTVMRTSQARECHHRPAVLVGSTRQVALRLLAWVCYPPLAALMPQAVPRSQNVVVVSLQGWLPALVTPSLTLTRIVQTDFHEAVAWPPCVCLVKHERLWDAQKASV